MATILEISDATTTIELNLDEGVSGFKLGGLEDAWLPTNPFYKNGGTWQSSPLADGRQLVDRRFENTTETFAVHVEGSTQDNLISEVQDLKRLLEKAADYWTGYLNVPTYIKAKADNETNSRYAIIYTGRIVRDGNPYACRFGGGVGSTNIYWMWDLQLIIEHGMWSENAPGSTTATNLSAVETYDGRNLGNVDNTGVREPTTTKGVYVANKDNMANLSDIYVNDGGVWTGNRMDVAVPWNLLPAVPAIGDAVYFGIDTSLTNSGPFCSLAFDIGTAQSDITGIAWEYFNGAWVALTVEDNTNADGAMTGVAFDTTGEKSVHWVQPSDWTTRDISTDGGPAITGYWVRARVTAIGTPTAPSQQNRDVFSIVWPYTEIQSTEVLGDIPSLFELHIWSQSDQASGSTPALDFNRVICGLRSYARGANFTSFLNFSDEQVPSGLTVSGASLSDSPDTPTGRRSYFNVVDSCTVIVNIYFNISLTSEYF